MWAALLWCVFVVGTRVSAAIITRNGSETTSGVEKRTEFPEGGGFLIENAKRRIVVEEVDRHGKSVVRELELPDYDGGEEEELEKKRVREQVEGAGAGGRGEREDLYGCNSPKESQRRKCLQRQKKFIKGRYKNWKALFRRIIKDLDGKIKTIRQDGRKQGAKGSFNFVPGFSPKNMMRKKE